MAASPTIYLHIGHGKVASTTIQRLLRSNADEIRRQGFLIVDMNFEYPRSGPIQDYSFNVLQEWMADPESRKEKLSEALRRLYETCRSGGDRGAIISSELLCNRPAAEWFAESAGGVPLHTLFYVRRQDWWLESAWKQWGLKVGTPLEDFLEGALAAGHPAYLLSARAWREAVGHLTVRPIEGVDNVQAHFAEWCGLNFSRLQPVEPANQTFDWALLDLFSRNSFLFENENDNRLFNSLNLLLPDEVPRDGHGMLTADQARRVWSTFEDENRELRREFFPDLPVCDWDRAPIPQTESGRMEQFGSIDSVFRNLAIQLSILGSLQEQFRSVGQLELQFASLAGQVDRIGESITRRFNRLRSRLEREEARRRALEKRLERLESHSLRRLVSERFGKLKARWPGMSAGAKRPETEAGADDS